MYNRYIPQPDGSYRRNRVGDPPMKTPPTAPREKPVIPDCAPEVPTFRAEKGSQSIPHYPRNTNIPHRQRKPVPENTGIGTFLKQLLPRDFDTEDLLIILLLLLMSADSQEDQNAALLTLVIYLFL